MRHVMRDINAVYSDDHRTQNIMKSLGTESSKASKTNRQKTQEQYQWK